MGMFQGFKNMFVGEDDLEQEEYQPAYDKGYTAQESRGNMPQNDSGERTMKMEQTQTLQIVLARPKDYSEVKSIGDDLNAQKTVLLNLETVRSEDAKRILDFLSGVAYANGAEIKMMAAKTFAIMPSNVGFSGVDLMSELENNGYSF